MNSELRGRVVWIVRQKVFRHLVIVDWAVGDGLPLLLGHQVYQLVDKEGGREGHHPARGNPDQFPTYWTSESANCKCPDMRSRDKEPEAELPGICGDDPLEAGYADGVGAGEQLGAALPPVIATEAGAACEEWLVEVLVVDWDSLHECALYGSTPNILPRNHIQEFISSVVRNVRFCVSPSVVIQKVLNGSHPRSSGCK